MPHLMKAAIEDIIKNGLIPDIYKAEQAIFFHKKIGDYSTKINSSKDYIKSFFAYTQNLAFIEAILALSRVYDTPNERYPIRCLKNIILKLKNDTLKAPEIIEDYQTIEQLKIHHMPEIIIKQVEKGDHIQFAKYFSWHIECKMEHGDFQEKLDELKNVRDKALAHNEIINKVFKIKWTTFDYLLQFAQCVIGILGWAYFSTVYMAEGKYELTDMAKRIEFDLISTLKELKII
jgi:hypothetical protein